MKKVILFVVLVLLASAFRIKAGRKRIQARGPPNDYPIRVGYVDHNHYWYGENVCIALGVPGYAEPHIYNYILLAFWSCNAAPKDMASIWADAYNHFGGAGNPFGANDDEVQKELKRRYN